ncbi:hypothetical protein F441_10556 [Phytophthora nicotianae CJ01A1]|uniref:Uncharacterized protein n=2 Tax=Phytophthora nicotianae TaxID=4792 RepID=W2GN75_PHYNI|nr:hypothetical protein L915_10599 [Phytophthora nicotianae]ETL38119.1 hypothetical protein L916_10274 [Phytophthora nicotianae]ETP14515.1 hypothetical protein F441_10556 [Phytophthora nicotianae CJ01A1]
MERHLSLTIRTFQSVSKFRNDVEEQDLSALFSSLAKVVIEHDIGASRVFSVGETAIKIMREHEIHCGQQITECMAQGHQNAFPPRFGSV